MVVSSTSVGTARRCRHRAAVSCDGERGVSSGSRIAFPGTLLVEVEQDGAVNNEGAVNVRGRAFIALDLEEASKPVVGIRQGRQRPWVRAHVHVEHDGLVLPEETVDVLDELVVATLWRSQTATRRSRK